MLSSQTKDMVTGGAMTNLKKHGLNIENILKTPEEDIAKMIHPVGFWKVCMIVCIHVTGNPDNGRIVGNRIGCG